MNEMLAQMVALRSAQTPDERKLALREVAQEVVLCGLARAGFFKQAAFYGGTALRVFYGLDRYSEDMDFSLVEPNAAFSLASYLPTVEKECQAWGLQFSSTVRSRKEISAIESAFLKANTQYHLLTLFPNTASGAEAAPDEVLKIKLEIDTDPAPGATFEKRYQMLPMPYQVSLYDTPSLFAGKIHAVICRAWKMRVKGRDLYDYVFIFLVTPR